MGDYLQNDFGINLDFLSLESFFQYFLEAAHQSYCQRHPTNKDPCSDLMANEIDPQKSYFKDLKVVV